jgi:hypothetical protein
MRTKIGDVVRVKNLGLRYASYVSWIKKYDFDVDKFNHSTLRLIRSSGDFPKNSLIVIHRAPHLNYNVKMLCYVESLYSDCENILIEEDGLEVIKTPIEDIEKINLLLKERRKKLISVGDTVEIENAGEVYPNYDTWLEHHNLSKSKWVGDKSIPKREKYIVRYIGDHLVDNRILAYVESVKTGDMYIMDYFKGLRKSESDVYRCNEIIEDVFRNIEFF